MVVQASDYGVWGDVLREQLTDAKKYRFGYQGQFAEKDEETGWNHFELREFNTIIGRWMAPDPYGEFWSPFLAMANNPIVAGDPNGGCTTCPFGSLISPVVGQLLSMNGVDYRFTGSEWAPSIAGEAEVSGGSNFVDKVSDEFDNAVQFFDGAANAIISDHLAGANLKERDSYHYQNGQLAGHVVSLLMGYAEMGGGATMALGGGTVTVVSGGTLGVVGVPAAGLGTAIALEGLVTTGVAAGRIREHLSRMKGERNRTAKPDGTDNPWKKFKPDPTNPKRVIYKDQNGKTVYKPKPDGFDEWWNSK